jgi:hypothetical protein
VVIHVLDVFLRREHFVVLQRLPSPVCGILSGVKDDAVRVQMRIDRSRTLVLEKRSDDVARAPITIGAAFAKACRREPFQFSNRSSHGLAMSSHDPRVIGNKRSDGNGLRRGDSEVETYSAIRCFTAYFVIPRCLLPLSQSLVGTRMPVFAE